MMNIYVEKGVYIVFGGEQYPGRSADKDTAEILYHTRMIYLRIREIDRGKSA